MDSKYENLVKFIQDQCLALRYDLARKKELYVGEFQEKKSQLRILEVVLERNDIPTNSERDKKTIQQYIHKVIRNFLTNHKEERSQ